jgi:chorismate mutase
MANSDQMLSREEMEKVIAEGGSVMHNGRIIPNAAGLPSRVELAQGRPEEISRVADDLDAEIAKLVAQRAQLSAQAASMKQGEIQGASLRMPPDNKQPTTFYGDGSHSQEPADVKEAMASAEKEEAAQQQAAKSSQQQRPTAGSSSGGTANAEAATKSAEGPRPQQAQPQGGQQAGQQQQGSAQAQQVKQASQATGGGSGQGQSSGDKSEK